MKDCKTTTLKADVNADLEKFDVLTLEVSPNISSVELDIRRYVGHEMSWSEGITLVPYGGGAALTSPTTITNTVLVTSGNNGGVIEIDGEYNMDGVAGSNGNMLCRYIHPKYFDTLKAIAPWWVGDINTGDHNNPDIWHLKGSLADIADFVNKDTIGSLVLANCNVSGNLSDLPVMTACIVFGLSKNTGVTGDIASVGGWTGLTTLNLEATSVTGTVESLITAQRTAGRTTGSIKIYAGSTSITYNGNGFNGATFTWDAQGNITVS